MKSIRAQIKKTYARIFLSVAVSMMAMIIIIANILYINYEKIGLKTAYEFNIKYLKQVSYNITYMNDFIIRYCISQYYEPDMQKFMYSKEKGDEFYFDFTRSIGKLQNSTLNYPMIHTVVAYNGFQNKIYSTYSMEGKVDLELQDIFMQRENVPVLKPVPRIIPTDIYSKDQNLLQNNIKVLTFFMIEYESNRNSFNCAFAVNVNTEWIFNSLKRDSNDESKLMLIDQNGTVIADETNLVRPFEKLEENYVKEVFNKGDNGGSFIVHTSSGKKVVTCYKIPDSDWTLVNEQEYDYVLNHIKQIRDYTFTAVIVFVILALITASVISKSIYNPIHNVVKRIREALSGNLSSQGIESDTDYIQKAFDISINQIRELEKYKKNTRDVLKENLIKTLLIDTATPMQQLSEENLYGISSLLKGEGRMLVILLKIDRYSDFVENDMENRKLVRFLIANSFSEKFSEQYLMEMVPMGNGEFVVVLNLGEGEPDMEAIKKGIAEVQEYVIETADISFTAFISAMADGKDNLYNCYKDLSNVVKYKIMYAQGHILDRSIIESKVKASNNFYPEDAENKILSALKSENLQSASCEFTKFMDFAVQMNIDNFMISISRLALSIDRMINLININRIGEIGISFNDFYGKLLRMEDLDDIKDNFINLFKLIIEQQKEVTGNRNNQIVSSILEYINMEYANKNLTLKDIASKIKMSYGYLSLTFKESMGKSMAEYLNEFRLSKAAELLRSTDYSVLEIIDKVGYDSESNFYKLFKKYFGTTPREYRLGTDLIQKNTN